VNPKNENWICHYCVCKKCRGTGVKKVSGNECKKMTLRGDHGKKHKKGDQSGDDSSD